MYENHFGLTRKPFSIVPNPEVLFPSKNHANALTYLEYGLSERVGFILLTGEIGTGKTTLVRRMLLKVEAWMDIAVLFNTNFSSDQLFRLILSEFDVPCDGNDKAHHLDILNRFLIDRYAKKRHVLLVIDEAQNLSEACLEDIRMLSNLQTDDRILLQIMLVGQPELKMRLQQPSMRQLAQRIAVNYHLAPLSEDQTRAYIAYRIKSAGGTPDLFSDDAIRIVHENAGGIPRTINLLCDSALVYGYADDLKQVDRRVMDQVLQDETCLAVINPHRQSAVQAPSASPAATKASGERLAAMEAALADLKQRHDALEREVRHELLFKYQELLIGERKRYDQLLAKYNKLLRLRQGQGNSGGENDAADKAVPASAGHEGNGKEAKGFLGRIWRKDGG